MSEPTATWIAQERVDAPVARIRVVGGSDAGREVVIGSERIIVGSGPSAPLRLSDPTVSRIHCEISREGPGARLKDLGSKNGCWLGSTRVYDVELAPGAQVRVGGTTLEARVDRERVARLRWLGGHRFGELVGASAPMHALFALATKMAGTEERILLRGESGTGKEALARAIHAASGRRDGPFIVLDCGALSRGVADAELFGHVRGAFTGALGDRAGAFELADRGTLFIDEIGELPIDMQPKLLRAIEAGEVRRLGESVPRRVQARLIAATNASLERMVNAGTFREDLLYRLCAFELLLPPLREREGDALRIAAEMAAALAPGDPDALVRVEKELDGRAGHPWPGNVRELRNFVRRVIALGSGSLGAGPVLPSSAPPRTDLGFREAKQEHVRVFEEQYLRSLLAACSGNVAEASRRAGLHRSTFYELMQKHGMAADR